MGIGVFVKLKNDISENYYKFEDVLKHPLNTKSWIPVYSRELLSEVGEFGYDGYNEEYFGAISILIDRDKKNEALEVEWTSANISAGNKGWVDNDDEYIISGIFSNWKNNLTGNYLVLDQLLETGDNNVWHLEQDLVLSLNLLRKDDVWVAPEEDYLEIARLKRDRNGKPKCFEIRAEHLKDYLHARKKGLLIATFRSRTHIYKDQPDISLPCDNSIQNYDWGTWAGYITLIHEGGFPFGEKIGVFRARRTDIDSDDDVPQLSFPTDEDVETESYEIKHTGAKLYRVCGELWKNYWIEPGTKSPRIKGDTVESTIPFYIDNEGTTATSTDLIHSGKWLWFKPTIIRDILNKTGGFLNWYSENTGSIGTANTRAVHFGVNKVGLINVYAKDIAVLPEWIKRSWASHNLAPEGGISEELLMSQVQVNPAKTIAPEISIFKNISSLNKIFKIKYGDFLFKSHPDESTIKKNIHRFLPTNLEGFLLLSKELTRYIIDRIDTEFLKKLNPTKDKLGSIKRLAMVLDKESKDGRKLTAPLVGVYELRISDAHLPCSDINDALSLVGFSSLDDDFVENGKLLIRSISDCIGSISQALR
jgi:hypothetical protein